MKRDMDLIRKILLEAEQDNSDHGLSDFLIPGFTQEQIGYHVYLLKNAGLVEGYIGFDNGSVNVGSYDINRMTFAGHDFLDAIRDDVVWTKRKEKVIEFGVGAFLELVKTLGVAAALARLS